jgi:hypothetical protein
MMRKKIIVMLSVLALLFAMLPSGNAQAKVGTSNINIRNHTGGTVTLVLRSAEGNTTLTLPDGVYNLSFPSIVYNYYAVTPCGNQGGKFNLTSSKQMYFFCGNGPDIFLQNAPKPEPVAPVCVPTVSSRSTSGHFLRRNLRGGAQYDSCGNLVTLPL